MGYRGVSREIKTVDVLFGKGSNSLRVVEKNKSLIGKGHRFLKGRAKMKRGIIGKSFIQRSWERVNQLWMKRICLEMLFMYTWNKMTENPKKWGNGK